MDIQMITELWGRMGWVVLGILLGWLAAKIWSHKEGWALELDSDHLWVRLWAIVGGLVPLLQAWTLLAIPLMIWAHNDAEMKAQKEHIRHIKRMAHNKWWGETQYRWERQWERVPRKGR